MKYLLIDTNVYIDMIVARNQAHTPEAYEHLMKLIEYQKVKVIMPKIVVKEVSRHLEDEIDKIGDKIKEVNKEMEKIYWVNDVNEVKNFNQKLGPVKNDIKGLEEEFKNNIVRFKEEARRVFERIEKHKETILIPETEEIIYRAIKRQLYKRKPFEYKKTDKDCMADAVIIETLLHTKEVIEGLSEEDIIYFVSKNYKDFCKSRSDKNFHNDIMKDIKNNGLLEIICYREHFTSMILNDFKEEIEEIGIGEEVKEEYDIETVLVKAREYDKFKDWGEVEEVANLEAIGEMVLNIGAKDFIETLNKIEDIFSIYSGDGEEDASTIRFWKYIVENVIRNKELEEAFIKHIKQRKSRMMWFVQHFPSIWEVIKRDKRYMQDTVAGSELVYYLSYYQWEGYREAAWNLVKKILEEEDIVIPKTAKETLVDNIVKRDNGIPPKALLDTLNKYNFLEKLKEYLFTTNRIDRSYDGIMFANSNAAKIKLYLTERVLEKEVVEKIDHLYNYVYYHNFHDTIKKLLEDEQFKQEYENVLKQDK